MSRSRDSWWLRVGKIYLSKPDALKVCRAVILYGGVPVNEILSNRGTDNVG